MRTIFFQRHLDGEEVLVRIVHKHWLLGLYKMLLPLFSLVCCIGFAYIAPIPVVLYVVAILAGASLLWLAHRFFDYYLDVWIITSQGVIDLAWFGWFHRQSSRVIYSDIQGVSYEIHGFWSTVLHFGTVSIEKVSTGTVLSLDFVFKPRSVEALILQKMEAYMHSKNMNNAKQVQEILSTFVADSIHSEKFSKGSQATRAQTIGEVSSQKSDNDAAPESSFSVRRI